MPQRWKHKRTGVIYIQLYRGLMQIAEGGWVECMMYQNEDTRAVFARDLKKFSENFEVV